MTDLSTLPPLRMLIVEDEALISLLIETIVQELGHEIAASAFSVAGALAALEEREACIDAAMLDINLGGVLAFPVADALAQRGIPFIFLTAYGAHAVSPRFSQVRVIQKPFTEKDLADAMALLQRQRFSQARRQTSVSRPTVSPPSVPPAEARAGRREPPQQAEAQSHP